jgi:hypothetical protein
MSAAGIHLPRAGRLRGLVRDICHEEFDGRGKVAMARHATIMTRRIPVGLPAIAKDHFGDLSRCHHDAFFCAELRQPFVLTDSGWILTRDRRLLFESLADDAFYEKRRIRDRWLWPRVERSEKTMVLAYPHWARDNYYHWLLEFLPRLAPVIDPETPGFLSEWRNAQIIVPPRLQPWMRETMRALGLPEGSRYESTGEQLQCHRLLFCSRLGRPMNTPRWAIEWLRSRFLKNVPAKIARRKRLFVSRRNAAKRRLVNEQEIEAVLHAEGFETVVLEGMSVAEQARVFAEAEIIVAPHGAGLANVVFARNARVIEIFEPSWVWPTFCALSLDSDNDYQCLVGRTVNGVDIHIEVDEVRRCIKGLL